MTRYPGAEPAEVERLITEPISREIQSMSGVYKIKSESMYGLSKITFELQPSLSASSIPQKWEGAKYTATVAERCFRTDGFR